MNESKAKVFVVHESLTMNFSDAERFGEIVFITNANWNPHRGSLSNEHTTKGIARRIHDEYDPERDFVILNGPPVLIGYAFYQACVKSMLHGCGGVRILSWDKRSGKYIEGLAECPAPNNERVTA